MKSPPWTDTRGVQQEYKNHVKLWKSFHDALPALNSNKILENLQAICLKYQLFGRATDLCLGITTEQVQGNDGVNLIVNAIYQRDGLSVVSEAYRTFNDLLATKRGHHESMKSFELRLSASMAKFNAIADSTKLPDCLTALMMIANSNINDAQRVSVLASAASSSTDNEENGTETTNEEFVNSISYNAVSSVIKQCDSGESKRIGYNLNGNSGHASSNRNYSNNNKSNYKQKVDKTMKYPCAICKKYGHWKNEHWEDGSLPVHVPSFDKPQIRNSDDKKANENNKAKSKTVTFSSAHLVKLDNHKNKGNIPKCKCKTVSHANCDYCDDWSLPQVDEALPNLKTLVGNCAALHNCSNNESYVKSGSTDEQLGPLVDDGAPFSAIGMVELKILYDTLGIEFPKSLNPIPDSLSGYSHFQYGKGNHESKSRKILGSVILRAFSDSNIPIDITHIVLSGSSQSVVGRNVTRKVNINHLEYNALEYQNNGTMDKISLVDHEFLSYIKLSKFLPKNCKGTTLYCLNARSLKNKPWEEVKKIIDKVHRHVCGHASLTDFKLLFERNGLWDEYLLEYIVILISNCRSCRKSSNPAPSRKVSISTLSKEFNHTICVDHFYLDDLCLVYFMDLVTRFSTAAIVSTTFMKEAILHFEQSWITHFWYPQNMKGDKAFSKGDFKEYLSQRDIKFELVPPGRHSKNALESKHATIRSIYLRLKNDDAYCKKLAAIMSVSISNDLYGNSEMSAFELSKGFSKPISSQPAPVTEEILEAYQNIQARRKLALILKSKALQDPKLNIGDTVDIYQHGKNNKRGQWSEGKTIIDIDLPGRYIKVAGKNGHIITASFEDVRSTIPNHDLTKLIADALDKLDEDVDDEIDIISDGINPQNTENQSPTPNNEILDEDFGMEHQLVLPSAGDNIQIYWDGDDVYYSGTVADINDDRYTINYDDGETDTYNLNEEVWKYQTSGNVEANSSNMDNNLQVKSNEQEILLEMQSVFGNKSFMKFQCQGFQQHPLVNAYKKEEKQFLDIVECIPIEQVPPGSNIINSHVLYKLKSNDDQSLALKARIAPHGNEDKEKHELTSDCALCSPAGIRIVHSIAALFDWKLKRADAKGAFLKTGKANRNILVKPPNESSMRATHLWRLLVAAYGLVNEGAKWQIQSDELLFQMGFVQSKFVPQLFLKFKDNKLEIVLAKLSMI